MPPPPISPLETEALVPGDSNDSNAAPTGMWNKWRKLIGIILLGCFVLFFWDRIELESAEDGGVIIKVKMPSLRGKVVVAGSSGPALTKPPRVLLE